jgi:hypothetical protein
MAQWKCLAYLAAQELLDEAGSELRPMRPTRIGDIVGYVGQERVVSEVVDMCTGSVATMLFEQHGALQIRSGKKLHFTKQLRIV